MLCELLVASAWAATVEVVSSGLSLDEPVDDLHFDVADLDGDGGLDAVVAVKSGDSFVEVVSGLRSGDFGTAFANTEGPSPIQVARAPLWEEPSDAIVVSGRDLQGVWIASSGDVTGTSQGEGSLGTALVSIDAFEPSGVAGFLDPHGDGPRVAVGMPEDNDGDGHLEVVLLGVSGDTGLGWSSDAPGFGTRLWTFGDESSPRLLSLDCTESDCAAFTASWLDPAFVGSVDEVVDANLAFQDDLLPGTPHSVVPILFNGVPYALWAEAIDGRTTLFEIEGDVVGGTASDLGSFDIAGSGGVACARETSGGPVVHVVAGEVIVGAYVADLVAGDTSTLSEEDVGQAVTACRGIPLGGEDEDLVAVLEDGSVALIRDLTLPEDAGPCDPSVEDCGTEATGEFGWCCGTTGHPTVPVLALGSLALIRCLPRTTTRSRRLRRR